MTAVRQPPKFVPTLTEAVRTIPLPLAEDAPMSIGLSGLTEEQVVHRVMQRVDLVLDRRLREAISVVVLEQTRDLGPILRDEIEAVVRDAVTQALAAELGMPGDVPGSGTRP